ncbi:hypothetical protein HII36_05730 [Nonomuraea sp. NN258]|uniref:hypothetical protein n=1 Tax=Nonomuraea antri TaxID=2730852 RepID=UPI0015680DAC|nr:hypothetical protein [Nonomuraea antri]NRQ31339.1 hypothetical protein [Nonomuraea antri]
MSKQSRIPVIIHQTMICRAIRVWLLGLTAMSAVSWAATFTSLLLLLSNEAFSVIVFVLLAVWTAVVPVPVTFQTVRWWRRVRMGRHVSRLGQKHKRSFEAVQDEIRSIRR